MLSDNNANRGIPRREFLKWLGAVGRGLAVGAAASSLIPTSGVSAASLEKILEGKRSAYNNRFKDFLGFTGIHSFIDPGAFNGALGPRFVYLPGDYSEAGPWDPYFSKETNAYTGREEYVFGITGEATGISVRQQFHNSYGRDLHKTTTLATLLNTLFDIENHKGLKEWIANHYSPFAKIDPSKLEFVTSNGNIETVLYKGANRKDEINLKQLSLAWEYRLFGHYTKEEWNRLSRLLASVEIPRKEFYNKLIVEFIEGEPLGLMPKSSRFIKTLQSELMKKGDVLSKYRAARLNRILYDNALRTRIKEFVEYFSPRIMTLDNSYIVDVRVPLTNRSNELTLPVTYGKKGFIKIPVFLLRKEDKFSYTFKIPDSLETLDTDLTFSQIMEETINGINSLSERKTFSTQDGKVLETYNYPSLIKVTNPIYNAISKLSKKLTEHSRNRGSRLEKLLEYTSRLDYIPDITGWRDTYNPKVKIMTTGNKARPPMLTELSRGGDCEDFSLYLSALMQAAGFKPLLTLTHMELPEERISSSSSSPRRREELPLNHMVVSLEGIVPGLPHITYDGKNYTIMEPQNPISSVTEEFYSTLKRAVMLFP